MKQQPKLQGRQLDAVTHELIVEELPEDVP
jgi:hypothetical protein